MKRLLRSAAIRRLGGRLVGLYLRIVLRTTRWTIDMPPESRPFLTGADGRTAIVAFWHETLPLAPALWAWALRQNPSMRVTVLISRHRDGRMITDIIERWKLAVVSGSSRSSKSDTVRDKGGTAAVRQLLGLLADGSSIAITPDGPRGPRRTLQPGVARLAALSGVPVIAFAGTSRPARQLGSWDRMKLPLPFGRGLIACSAPITVPPGAWRDGQQAIASALESVVRAVGA